jgi:DNA-binding HxlR family transcriptional regulator
MADDSTGDSNEENDQIGNLDRSQNPPQNEPELDDSVGISDENDSGTGANTPPDKTNSETFDKEEINDFFEKKAAVEILAQLSDGPKRFNEIDTAIVASHGTISSRLTEGAKLGLWDEYFQYPDDGGKTKLYDLTPAAKHLAELAEEKNIRETTEQLREIDQRHANAVSAFRDKVQADDTAE